ncbi:uncharacterized protein SPPG_05669 [Spizellomyces punctatus DAOM BR117]|uniref:Phospholipid:diacylglycerol acyltransferase n=1 Tax=Spizellomyces punctatus (strain DAOM BR117) TaxID=645134 RepID=A0A0L0HF60_SPIPD|nr:uncharacterized protein SPPG_05669 [Spizellomyces punctatus DAOM BR117]KNC99428.1 hypothetical protein SPPG_05669 [Spizellomyces punctatus DAOM BR117]|eukprot:XP_016607468.1 hypothetical protein SPPG_05669 [Spizellomyces punctatus DAOM BR117]
MAGRNRKAQTPKRHHKRRTGSPRRQPHVDETVALIQSQSRDADTRVRSRRRSFMDGPVGRKFLEYRRVFFFAGTFLGVISTLLAAATFRPALKPIMPMHRMSELFSGALGDVDLSEFLPEIPGISSYDLLGNLTSMFQIPSLFGGTKVGSPATEYEQFLPGARLAGEGLAAKHPVILIPGIVSTGLEVWNIPVSPKTDSPLDTKNTGEAQDQAGGRAKRKPQAKSSESKSAPAKQTTDEAAAEEIIAMNRACGQKYFRKRIWGTTDHFKALLLNNACWVYHMMLDETTGLDPPGVKLRAAQGLDAADYLFPGYWVWAKLISNLGALGYDNNNMHLAAYDWRLSFANLEKRDLYFTKLKNTIEISYLHAGGGPDARSVVVTHSMGSTVFMYFMSWIRSDTGAGAGEQWIQKYLKDWVNIAGTLLGVPKALPTMLSGEMKDTAMLNGLQAFVLENYLMTRAQRARLFRSWGGLASMLPYGGETIWGRVGQPAPDEGETENPSFGEFLTFYPAKKTVEDSQKTGNRSTKKTMTLSADTAEEFILDVANRPYWAANHKRYVATSKRQLLEAKDDNTAWTNPLLTPLPHFSPDFKIYCLYGTGRKSERKYFYNVEPKTNKSSKNDESKKNGDNGKYTPDNRDDEEEANEELDFHVDTTYSQEEANIYSGVQLTDGDGTVPLISLGYMCAKGWKHKRYNPAQIPVITREFRDKPAGAFSPRGGPGSADHVDILGNYDMTEDILRIVAGKVEGLEDSIFSEIEEIAKRVELPNGLD